MANEYLCPHCGAMNPERTGYLRITCRVCGGQYEARHLVYLDSGTGATGDVETCAHVDAVKWNPYNNVVQCHRCGEVFTPSGERVKVDTQSDDGDGMNSRKFARQWLEQRGMFDADADYGGMVGEAVMEVVETIARQGHTEMSAMSVLACIDGIYRDYNDPDSPQWKAYWDSPEGKALAAAFMGEEGGQ